ncbi:transposase [Streptomyces sp. NPDC048266]|uniref:transposase n=1 Tax=Streptomyces sp. NPDC048266 TaxID=3155787 RepID=UPI0033D8488E
MPSGRSRGGLSTKIHLAADSRCRPLAFVLAPGQAGDAPAFPEVMAWLRAPWPIGRPRIRPDAVLADKAYSSRPLRSHLRRHGIRAVSAALRPGSEPQTARPARRPSAVLRPRGLQAAQHRRTLHQQAQARARPDHRYDKTATIYLSGLHIAAIFIWSAR